MNHQFRGVRRRLGGQPGAAGRHRAQVFLKELENGARGGFTLSA
jgi:hypothetical protein